jgi:hypothetical protein
MDKQNLNETNSSSSSTPTSAKRFRSDMASIRAKQTTPINNNNNMNNKRAQIPYRNNNQYQRQYHHQHNHEQQQQQQQQQQQNISSSPTHENLEDNLRQLMNETRSIADMDLNMNCMDEQLTEAQLAHCPVKVNLI